MSSPDLQHENKALGFALELLRDGRLSLDGNGGIWRNACCRHGRWVPIRPRRAECVGGSNYLKLALQVDGRLRSVQAHRVVWTYLVGPIPEGLQINHKDKNKQNNRIENLEVVTNQENMDHAWALGKNKPWSKGGSGNWRGKPLVSTAQKEEIYALRAGGLLYKQIAERMGISTTHAHRICSGKETL